ncbi:hypothetical protein [Peribacillus sp. FSL E2-0218]|uniref:hypothetical protein n=1 Tax=Peribacillus sp. FSL E2-0218 TaxID=2921364 RepID=UPI0030EB9DD2
MEEAIMDYLLAFFLVVGFTYGLFRQMGQCVRIRGGKGNGHASYRRIVIGNDLACLSYAGFLVFYMLNLLLGLRMMPAGIFTSENTSFSCFSFLALFLIAKFGVIPKEVKQVE